MAMMGPGVSLSAGVAVGHYKTPMSVLLQRSHELLKQAKEAGRARVGFGHASRGGTKSGAVLPWGQGNQSAYCTIETVVEGFKRRQIPSRLPYKLREVAPALRVEVESVQERELLCRGLFSSCWDEGSSQPKLRDAAYRLWYQGVAACHERAIEGGVCDYEPATEGLLFCRELAGLGGET